MSNPVKGKEEEYHLGVFDLQIEDASELLSEFNSLMNTPLTPLFNAFDFDNFHLKLFEHPNSSISKNTLK